MNKKELAHFHKIFAKRFDDRTVDQPVDRIRNKVFRTSMLFITIAVIWAILSYRFTFKVEQDLIRMRDAGWISFNEKTVKIEAIKFLVTIEDVILFPDNDKLQVKSDRLIMFYNPVADRIRAKLDSEKLRIFSHNTEIYIDSPDYIASFDRGLANQDYENFKFYLTSEKNIVARFADDHSILYEHDNVNLSSSNSTEEEERHKDIYDLRLTYTIKGLVVNHNYRYFENLSKDLIKDDYLAPHVTNYIRQVIANGKQEAHPDKTEYEVNYRLKLRQEPAKELRAFLLGKQSFKDAIKDFDVFKEKFNLYMRERAANKIDRGVFKFSFINDGQYLMTDMDMKGMNYLANQYKIELLKVLKPYLAENINEIFAQKEAGPLAIKEPELANKLHYYSIHALDFLDKFGRVVANVDNFTPYFYARHNYRLNDKNSDFIFHGENLRAKLSGIYKEETFDGYLSLSYFDELLIGAPTTYEAALRPALTKATARNKFSPEYLTFLTNLSNDLKDNGLPFLTSLHEGEQLSLNQNFGSYILFDFSDWQNFDNFIKINGQSLTKLLEDDPQIKYFVQNIFKDNKASSIRVKKPGEKI